MSLGAGILSLTSSSVVGICCAAPRSPEVGEKEAITLAGASPPANPRFHELLPWAVSSCVKQELKIDSRVSRIKFCVLVIMASVMRPAWQPRGQGFGFVLL